MNQWGAVLIAGAIGGFVNSLLTVQDVVLPFNSIRAENVDSRVKVDRYAIFLIIATTIIATLVGSLAGFVFWGLYDSGADIHSASQVRGIAGAALAGVAGGAFLRQAARQTILENTNANLKDTIKEVLDSQLKR